MANINEILSNQPSYRLKQIYQAWFDPAINGYGEITTLPKELREQLSSLPWLVVQLKTISESKLDKTKKALLRLADGEMIETVLMARESKKEEKGDDRYTICVSTQVGCPMGCQFCATGSCGFKRNLTAEEIIDQFRFWQRYLLPLPRGGEEGFAEAAVTSPLLMEEGSPAGGGGGNGQGRLISNIVLMGQGEPLLNYDNVKFALNTILNNTDIGPSKITLSTVGVPAAMDRMLEDKDFPKVRFALSLHSASEETRRKIIPSHQPGFLDFLVDWSVKYHEKISSRVHFIGLEYTMLKDVNDDQKHLKALIKLASKLGRVRINLIPYNLGGNTSGQIFVGSPRERIEEWHDALLKSGFTSTIRHSQGQDIAAACGQLRAKAV